MNESFITSAQNFENEVKEVLASALIRDERLIVGKLLDRSHRFVADFFLPEGCAMLGIKKGTIVEVKYVLRADTLKRVFNQYLYFFEKNSFSNILVLCKENLIGVKSFKFPNAIIIKIATLEEIKSKTGRINEAETRNTSSNVVEKDILDKARDTFELGKNTLFLGAGLSMDACLPSWNKLLESLLAQNNEMPFHLLNEANANAIYESCASSSIVTGRYVIEGYRNSIKKQIERDATSKKMSVEEQERLIDEKTNQEVISRIRNVLYKDVNGESELVKAVADTIALKQTMQVITYNYDDLVEEQLNDSSKYISVYSNDRPQVNLKPIYHVHGLVARNENSPGVPILSEREYHHLYSRMHHWANVVQLNALYTTTCFFIGFSMTDPNQRRLLDLARNRDINTINSTDAPHYIFLRKQKLRGEAVQSVNDEHCQEIEKMMFDFGLNVIWFSDFKKLPDCIRYVAGLTNTKPTL